MANLISFKTDLPYYLRLPFAWFLSYDDIYKECAINCRHRFGEIQFKKSTEIINNTSLSKMISPPITTGLPTYGYKKTDVLAVTGEEITTSLIDLSENGGFTELRAYTEIDMIIFVGDSEKVDSKNLKERFSNNLNHFINIYRLIQQDPYVKRINFNTDLYIQDISVAEIPEDLKDLPFKKIFESIGKIAFKSKIGEGRTTTQRLNAIEDIWPGKDLNDEILKQYGRLFLNKYEMPLHYELILDAQNFLKKSLFYLSIILSESALEVYIENLLRAILKDEGKSKKEINKLLNYEGPYSDLSERLTCLDEFLVSKFKSTEIFKGSEIEKKWKKDLYYKRCDVVHRGLIFKLTFENCKDAIKAAKDAINFFENKVGAYANNIIINSTVDHLKKSSGRILNEF